MVTNMARSPKVMMSSNTRYGCRKADIAVANTYYLTLMLSGKKGPEQLVLPKIKPLF